ncbi:uncharacterized protein LOC127097589 [Lathyrus oleraceus]|uniref:uncharacterized protein LOC127097589 n=1 Tax=Pisum sativum TaxID=3888 RepID=UPI0021D22FBE|nr:uncharacterized protein LOC127097589 [Pisum sativum]
MLYKKKVQCYSCKKFGHFVADCWSNKKRKSKEANIARGESNDEPVLLMASESDCEYLVGWWTKFRCADDKYLNTEGMGNVKVRVKNGKTVLIKDVWYVPGMKSNMMNKLIMNSEQGSNKTFKVKVEIVGTKCLSTEGAEGYSELWHKRLGHLNFKSLGHMSSKKLVHGIPKTVKPEKSCEICMRGEQPRFPFSLEVAPRAKHGLRVVHYDEKKLPHTLWGDVVATAAYVLNICPTKKLKEIVPFDKWIGDKQSMLREGSWMKKEEPCCLSDFDDDPDSGGNHASKGDRAFEGSCSDDITESNKVFMNEIEISDLENMVYFLGMEILYSDKGMILHQLKYELKLMKIFEKINCKSATTHAKTNHKLDNDVEGHDVDAIKFKLLVGSLRYLCNTRHDICYVVGMVSKIMNKPKWSHYQVVVKILRYIKGTMKYGVLFPFDVESNSELIFYSDSDWGGDKVNRKSTYGYFFKYMGGPISWCSKKQPMAAVTTRN